jgi:anti-sigma regulatory factor (Ser/Thr protein kinase)
VPETARRLRGYRLPVFSSLARALATTPPGRQNVLSDRLLPVAGAVVRAREAVTEACVRWQLPHLLAPAALIANELVTNAVQHAGTMADFRLSLGQRYLMISVRDGSAAQPRLRRTRPSDPSSGRGLLLVEATARQWGCIATDGGKVVWASLLR